MEEAILHAAVHRWYKGHSQDKDKCPGCGFRGELQKNGNRGRPPGQTPRSRSAIRRTRPCEVGSNSFVEVLHLVRQFRSTGGENCADLRFASDLLAYLLKQVLVDSLQEGFELPDFSGPPKASATVKTPAFSQ